MEKKHTKKHTNQANNKKRFNIKYKKTLIGLVALLVISISVIFVQAASDRIPYYKNENVLEIRNLIPGENEYLRVDDTAGVQVLGDYRYPTLYDGKIGGTSTRPSGSCSQNSLSNCSFKVGLTGKTITAYKGTPFYHIVPLSRGTARNLLEPSDLTEAEIRNVFRGDPDYVLNNIRLYTVRHEGDSLGEFYYIADIARLTGGFVEQTTEIDDINSTRLRWLVTDYPDLKSFKTDKSSYLVGDKIAFSFDGWEYVYGNNEFNYKIVVKKDGAQVGDFTGNGTSTKGATSTANPKQDSGHTGSFKVENVFNFEPKTEGVYQATLTVTDSVGRTETKVISIGVGENVVVPDPEDPGEEPEEPEPIPNEPPVAIINAPDEVEVGEKFCIRSDSYDTDGVIVINDWGYNGEYSDDDDEFTETTTRQCGLYFEDIGEQEVWLQVIDDRGASDDTEHTIKVLPPIPNADFEVGGYNIENRAMWIKPEAPYKGGSKAEKIAPITEETWIIRGKDNDNTVIHYQPKPQGSYNEMLIHVYFDTNNNGVGDEKDSGFIYSNKEHGFNKVYQGTDENGQSINFGFNNSGIDDIQLYSNVDVKMFTPENTFVLATPFKMDIVDVYSSIENKVFHAALVLKQN